MASERILPSRTNNRFLHIHVRYRAFRQTVRPGEQLMNFVPPLAGSVNLGMGLVIAAVAIGITVRAALLARQG